MDSIDYRASTSELFIAPGKAGQLAVAKVGPGGALSAEWTAPTAEGSRAVFLDELGRAYVPDNGGGRLLIFAPAP